jgi:hypothetical protein
VPAKPSAVCLPTYGHTPGINPFGCGHDSEAVAEFIHTKGITRCPTAAEPVVCHAPVRDGIGSTVAVSLIGCALSAVECIPHVLTDIQLRCSSKPIA